MRFQESARSLEEMHRGFTDAATSLGEILKDLKVVTFERIPERAPTLSLFSASAVVLAEHDRMMTQAIQDPSLIEVAVQLAKVGNQIRVCAPGGGAKSHQEAEREAQLENAGKELPSNLLYHIVQEQLERNGTLDITYDVDLSGEIFTSQLRNDLARELKEELGPMAARRIALGEFLPGELSGTLTSVRLPDAQASALIASKLTDEGVSLDARGNLRGVYTRSTEKVAVAFGDLDEVAALAVDNDEAKGMRIVTLADLLTLSRRTAESIKSFLSYRAQNSDAHQSDGVRGPATPWGLARVTMWLRDKVLAADTYKEGARSGPRLLNQDASESLRAGTVHE